MNEADYFDPVLVRYKATWPRQEVSKSTSVAWWPLLADLEVDEVLAAIEALGATERFPPHPADLRTWVFQFRLAEDGQPLWAEVWEEIVLRIGSYGADRWEDIPWSETVGRFMWHVGQTTWRQLCREVTPLATSEAQWRNKYGEWQLRVRTQRATEELPAVKALHAKRATEKQLQAAQSVAALAARKQLDQAG